MAKIKLTKSAVDTAEVTGKDYELRDTIVPGFLCKVTAHGRKVFMLQYRTNWGERRKPKIGQFGELTVEQARSIAQDWLADVRKGDDPSAAKLAARMAPTVKELCEQFIEEYSKPRNKPRTVDSYQGYIEPHPACLGQAQGARRNAGAHHHADEGQGEDRRHGQSGSGLSAQDVQHGRGVGLPA